MHNGAGTPSEGFYTEALVIGGGFSGIYALYKFRQLGISVKLVEAGEDFGGVWLWNKYPGARVDSEYPFYQLSIPEAYRTYTFKERFSDGPEIRNYFGHLARELDLRNDAIFNTIIEGVKWDQVWLCKTREGRMITCKYLILCTGSSYKRFMPAFDGLHTYSGTLVHTANYPKAIDLTGKRVAVIGNGSTGTQVIQEIAKKDCQLTCFIRTPIIGLPMRQRQLTGAEQQGLRSFYGSILHGARRSPGGFPYDPSPKMFSQYDDEEREAFFEELWQRGGFAFFLSNFKDFVFDKTVNKAIYDFWAKKTRLRITDPVKREIVAPAEQQHLFGVKRPSLEQDYYEAIDRPNVKLVNLKKTPIQRFTPVGIEADKSYEFDVVIMATGYDAMTGSMMDLGISDRDGRPLQEKWKNGVETYLGMTVAGMPNMFMVYGPQAPTALSNGPTTIELQVDWVVEVVKKMRAEGIATLEPEHECCIKWRQDIQDMNAKTLYPLENSWYMGANIPGKVREQLNFIGGVDTYNSIIHQTLEDWRGFIVGRT